MRIKQRIQPILDWLQQAALPPGARRAAAWAVALAAILATAYLGPATGSGFGPFLDTLGLIAAAGLALALGAWLGGAGLWLLRWLLGRLPLRLVALAATAYLLLQSFWHISERRVWGLSLGIVLLELLFGAALGAARAQRRQTNPGPLSVVAYLGIMLGLAGNIGLLAWFFSVGSADHLLLLPPYQGEATLVGSNPGEPGPYPVLSLTYGSGTDTRRPEFGEAVDLVTPTVSATSFVRLDGFNEWARQFYWGFGPEAFPLNGRVWYPDGAGPFPLVLLVHGNHQMDDYSDAGYAYLGEHLASHGYIFVSVDQNFLNAHVSGTVPGEMDARAWLLLRHLGVWDDWAAAATPLGSLVDMSQIVLMGHSRGGEAAALAAAYNQLERNPDNALMRWDFGYDIRGVVALAPTDQRLEPAGQPLPLTDINYLVLHGVHDADVSEFTGLRQYQRVTFTTSDTYHFKAALSIYQANHGQFNTTWNERDLGEPRGTLLNRAPLMPGVQQRQVAKLYLTAFLDATFNANRNYLPLFRDYHTAGRWLPPTLYVNQFQDSEWRLLTNFEEDIDVTTMTTAGGTIQAVGLTRWREQAVAFREGRSQDNRAVRLDWGQSSVGRYSLTLPPDLPAPAALSFNIADLRVTPAGAPPDLLDFHINLLDVNGRQTARPLRDFLTVLPARPVIVTRLYTWEEGSYGDASEIMQTVIVPLAAFPAVDPAQLRRIELQFDLTQNGQILLDEVGFWPAPAP